jgi:hypothetical protein
MGRGPPPTDGVTPAARSLPGFPEVVMDAIRITGGQGFTGRHLTARLTGAGAASSATTGTP